MIASTKSIRLGALVTVASLVFAACGTAATPSPSSPPAASPPGGASAPPAGSPGEPSSPEAPSAPSGELPPPEVTDITIGVSVTEMSQYAGVLAQQIGLYEKYGLNVELPTVFEGDGRVVAALQADQIQFAFAGTSSALSSQLTDAPYAAIGVNAVQLTDDLVCQAGIDSAEEVMGKSIAISTFGGTSNAAALLSLQALGLTPADAAITPTGGQDVRFAALQGGSVDCAIIDSNREEEMIGLGFSIAARLKEAEIEYGRSGLGVLESFLAENRNTALAVLAATLEAQNVIFTDEDTAAENYMAFTEVDEETARGLVQDFTEVGNRSLMWGDEAFNNARKTLAMINPDIIDVEVSDAFDRSLLEELVDIGFYDKIGSPVP